MNFKASKSVFSSANIIENEGRESITARLLIGNQFVTKIVIKDNS